MNPGSGSKARTLVWGPKSNAPSHGEGRLGKVSQTQEVATTESARGRPGLCRPGGGVGFRHRQPGQKEESDRDLKQHGTLEEQVDMTAGSQPRGSRGPTLQGPVSHGNGAPCKSSGRTLHSGAMRSYSGNNMGVVTFWVVGKSQGRDKRRTLRPSS